MALVDRPYTTTHQSVIVTIALTGISSYLTFSNIMTLNGTIRQIFLLTLHMAISCIISKIKQDIVRKSRFFHTPPTFVSPRRNIALMFSIGKLV